VLIHQAVKTAWGAGKEIWIHGWVSLVPRLLGPRVPRYGLMANVQMFDIEHGLLHDLECSVGPEGKKAASA